MTTISQILSVSSKDYKNALEYGREEKVLIRADDAVQAIQKAIIEDRKNVVRNVKLKNVRVPYTGVRAGGFYTIKEVDKDSIINAPQIELK